MFKYSLLRPAGAGTGAELGKNKFLKVLTNINFTDSPFDNMFLHLYILSMVTFQNGDYY
jgi:hypothetical protein